MRSERGSGQSEPWRRSAGRGAPPGFPRAPAPRIRRWHRMFFRSGPPPPPPLSLSPRSPPPHPPRPAPAPCLTPSRPRPGRAASLGCPGRRGTAPSRGWRVQGAFGDRPAVSRLPTPPSPTDRQERCPGTQARTPGSRVRSPRASKREARALLGADPRA